MHCHGKKKYLNAIILAIIHMADSWIGFLLCLLQHFQLYPPKREAIESTFLLWYCFSNLKNHLLSRDTKPQYYRYINSHSVLPIRVLFRHSYLFHQLQSASYCQVRFWNGWKISFTINNYLFAVKLPAHFSSISNLEKFLGEISWSHWSKNLVQVRVPLVGTEGCF